MIQGWSKFNENNDEIPSYLDMKDRLAAENTPQIKKVIDDVRNCFISFEDKGIINGYKFGGIYNPKKDTPRDLNINYSPSISGNKFHREPSKKDLESISEFFVPKYYAEFENTFISIGVDFTYDGTHGGWLNENGIDSIDDIIEAKNRLKLMGYEMKICFWQTKFDTALRQVDPLEIRVYFKMDCTWGTFITSSGEVIKNSDDFNNHLNGD
jgi:hypothetical protein